MTRHLRKIALSVLITTAPLFAFAGCYGNFPLVKTVYKFNYDLMPGNTMAAGFIRSVVMVIFFIVPVYGFASFLDVIIFNLIEFWTGTKLMTDARDAEGNPYMQYTAAGSVVTLTSLNEGAELRIQVADSEGERTLMVYRDQPGEFFALVDGKLEPVVLTAEERSLFNKELSYSAGAQSESKVVDRRDVERAESRTRQALEVQQLRTGAELSF